MPDLESDDSDVIASAGSGGAADPVLFLMMKDFGRKS